jgi:tRNA threonylcarbamoyladenosine biosynthesis protein TsaB
MKLIIDTTQPNLATFSIKEHSVSACYEFPRGHNDRTIAYLAAFLKKYKIKPRDITQIQAYSGPGSYTGVRVGATIAQALGFAWKIPVRITKTPA